MEQIVVIQDVKTREYYFSYRGDFGFNADIGSADTFDNESFALAEMRKSEEEDGSDIFSGRIIEIKMYYKF